MSVANQLNTTAQTYTIMLANSEITQSTSLYGFELYALRAGLIRLSV